MPEKFGTDRLQKYGDPSEDEIEIIDLLRILWKWRYLIIGGTVVCAIMAAVISYNMKKIYRIEMLISPGILNIQNNEKIFVDSAVNIKSLIEQGTLNNELLSRLGDQKSGSVPDALRFKVNLAPNTDMIRVIYESVNIDQGLRILNLMKDLLMEEYSPLVKYFQGEIEIEIQQNNGELEKLLVEQHSIKKIIGNLEKRINDLKSEIEAHKKNSDNLTQDRQSFLAKQKADNEILNTLLYSNKIQQNMSLLNQYMKQLSTYEIKLENEKKNLTIYELNSKQMENKISNLTFKKKNIGNIQLLKAPTASAYPVKPKKMRNVLFAAIVGLFSLVFLSFIIEYILKNIKAETSAAI